MDMTERQTKAPAQILTESGEYLVRGESTIYEGTHFLGKLGGFLPAKGSFGRLSGAGMPGPLSPFQDA